MASVFRSDSVLLSVVCVAPEPNPIFDTKLAFGSMVKRPCNMQANDH